MKSSKTSLKHLVLISFSSLILAACGGGDDGGSSSASPSDISFDLLASGINSDITLSLNGETLITTNTNDPISGLASLSVDDLYLITYTSSSNQLCRMENSSGTILEGSETVSITLNCLNWIDPSNAQDNISPNSEDTFNTDLAISNNGDSVVVWQQLSAGDTQIFMSEYRNGVLTNPSSILDSISPSGTNAHSPSVSMNNNGDTVITWIQSDGTADQVFISEYRNGSWTHPADEFDTIFANSQFANSPDVSIGDNGDTIIAWSQSAGSRDEIFISEYRSGLWTHPSGLGDFISPVGGDGSPENPQTAINATGDTLITWRQRDSNSNFQVYLSENRLGIWSHPASLAINLSPDATNVSNPEVSINDNGEALIAWSQSNVTEDHIFISEYRNGGWIIPVDLNDHISPSGSNAITPKLDLSNNGNAVIAWRQLSSNFHIFMSEYRNGTWNHPADLQGFISPTGGNASKPDVSINGSGETFISWQQVEGFVGEQIYKSEYRNGVWAHPQSLSEFIPFKGRASMNSSVAANDSGEALIIWEQEDAGSGGSLQVYQSTHR